MTVYRKFENDQYDRNRNTLSPGGYERGKGDYNRDYDRHYSATNNRDMRITPSAKNHASYDRPRNDNRSESRSTGYGKGHESNTSHGYGNSNNSHNFGKGQDSGRSQDRGRPHNKRDFVDYKSSNKKDMYKAHEDLDKSKGDRKKSTPKGRSTDDLWRNAGYGKAVIADRNNSNHGGSSGDKGQTGGNYPGSNTQSTWSQRGRSSTVHPNSRTGMLFINNIRKAILIFQNLSRSS